MIHKIKNKTDSICILNCVDGAKSFISKFENNMTSWVIVSTHGSVNNYLSTLNIDCLELVSLVPNDFIIKTFKDADTSVNTLLNYLDAQCADSISNLLKIKKMKYFYSMYCYPGKYEYLGTLKLIKAFKELYKQHPVKKVVIYDSVKTSRFDGDDLLIDVIKYFSTKYNFSLTVRKTYKIYQSKIIDIIKRIRGNIFHVTKAFQRLKKIFSCQFPARLYNHRKLVILLELLYDLEFLKNELKSFNVNMLIWPYLSCPKVKSMNEKLNSNEIRNIKSILSKIDISPQPMAADEYSYVTLKLLSKNIIKDFQLYIRDYLDPLVKLDRIHVNYNIDLAIWGNSPTTKSKAILVEYLLNNKVPIIGMQHGGGYCVQQCGTKHFDGDYSRCTHFLTYGFDKNDLENTYHNDKISCEIIPVGTCKEHRKVAKHARANKNIDILFPLGYSHNSITIDTLRVKPDILTENQIELLTALEEFDDLRIVASMPRYIAYKNCSIMGTLKRLKNIKVIDGMHFQDILDRYNVRAVIIKFTTTPLYEVIGRDIDIFMMNDPVKPFSKESLGLLKKRVNYFENINEMKRALVKWKEGGLPILRNNEFYNKYVFRKKTKSLIVDITKNILSPQEAN